MEIGGDGSCGHASILAKSPAEAKPLQRKRLREPSDNLQQEEHNHQQQNGAEDTAATVAPVARIGENRERAE